jgi:hypothetical protein
MARPFRVSIKDTHQKVIITEMSKLLSDKFMRFIYFLVNRFHEYILFLVLLKDDFRTHALATCEFAVKF